MGQPEQTAADSEVGVGNAELEGLRSEIDSVDRVILEKLNLRARLAQKIGRLKERSGDAVYVASRERQIVDRLMDANPGPFPDAALVPVFREIISATRSLEETPEVSYLGPEGTFSHLAARQNFGAQARLAGAATITEVFASVETGRTGLGIVPVENTTQGVVTETLDALAQFDVTICAESALRISHTLLSKSGRLEDVRRVASHPQPLAQCRLWLDRNLPAAERVETASTVVAARLAAEDASVAAIGNVMAGAAYELAPIATAIEDRGDNTTRFLVLGRQAPPPSGRDLTSVVFTIRKDQPGGLHRLIEPFAQAGLNLTSIQLRPIKGRPWEYFWFIDLEGHHSEARVSQALEAASGGAHSHRVLGSYPRAELEVPAGAGR